MTNELKRRVIEGAIERIDRRRNLYSCVAVFQSAHLAIGCSLDDSANIEEEYSHFLGIKPGDFIQSLEAMPPDQAKQKRIEMLREFLASLCDHKWVWHRGGGDPVAPSEPVEYCNECGSERQEGE